MNSFYADKETKRILQGAMPRTQTQQGFQNGPNPQFPPQNPQAQGANLPQLPSPYPPGIFSGGPSMLDPYHGPGGAPSADLPPLPNPHTQGIPSGGPGTLGPYHGAGQAGTLGPYHGAGQAGMLAPYHGNGGPSQLMPPQASADNALVPYNPTHVVKVDLGAGMSLAVATDRSNGALHELFTAARTLQKRVNKLADGLPITPVRVFPKDTKRLIPASVFELPPDYTFRHEDPEAVTHYEEQKKEYMDAGSNEQYAHAFAVESVEGFLAAKLKKQERQAKRAKKAASKPVFDEAIFAAMQAKQKLTITQIKALLVKHGHMTKRAKNTPKDRASQITKNLDIFGLVYYLDHHDWDPSNAPDQHTLDGFAQFKADNGMPPNEDWDGTHP